MSGMIRARGVVTTFLLTAMLVLATGCGGGGEARKARHVQQGHDFMAERNYTKARIEFRNALQIDPKDAGVRSMVGLSSEKLGEYDDAVKAYRVAIAADETLVMPRARLARILAVAGLDEEATELVTKGLELAPQSADLLSVRAVIREQKGDVAGARQDAEQAYAAAPTDADVVSTLAAVRWRAGERDEAIALVRKGSEARPDDPDLRLLHAQLLLAQERHADAERELVGVVRLVPGNAEYRNLLAQVYLLQGKTDQAIDLARDGVKASPDNVQNKLTLAGLLAAHRSFDDAARQLEEYRKAAPKNQELSLAVADFYAAGGRAEQAEAIYRNVIDSATAPARGFAARNQLAKLELRRGRIDEAEQLAGQVLAENPSDTDALVTRAEIALHKGDAASAVTDLRIAFSAQPDSVPVAVALARAYVRAGQNELAEQALRSVVSTSPRSAEARFALAQFLVETGRQKQARPVLEQLVAEQPNNLLAREGLTRLQIAEGDTAAALNTAKTLQALQPRSVSGYLLAGQVLQAQQRNDAARQAYEQAATVDPAAVEPVLALTRLDAAEGRPERALARLDERLASDSSSALLHALRGDVLLGLNRPRDALGSYSAAIRLTPGWSQPYRGQAIAHTALGEPERALEVLVAGVEATSGAPEVALDLALLQTRRGRIDDAAATYEAMLKRNPREHSAANNLAMLLVTHRSDTASLERARALAAPFANSENPGLLDTYGWVAFKRGQTAEAAAALEKAVARAPNAPELRYHLGMVQLELGRRDEARKNLEAAVAAGREFPGLAEAREALQAL
jgi:tetratricopeptide (TPR) repeat protein